MVGRFQLLMVSRTPSSSSPFVVKPVTFLPLMMDLPVSGSIIPGKIAPPWQLDLSARCYLVVVNWDGFAHTAETMPPSS